MAEHTHADELRAAERRLQAAQLASDIAALDQLLDDRLIFTYGPDGKCYTKQDDLHVHRSQQQVLTKVIEEDLTVLVAGRTGVTWFLGALEDMPSILPDAGVPERAAGTATAGCENCCCAAARFADQRRPGNGDPRCRTE